MHQFVIQWDQNMLILVVFELISFSPDATVTKYSEIYRLWIFVTKFFLWCSVILSNLT